MLCPSLSRVVGRVEVGSCKSHHVMKYELLVGGFNPFEKYACQIGSSPQVEVKINNIYLKPPPRLSLILSSRTKGLSMIDCVTSVAERYGQLEKNIEVMIHA